MIEKRIFYCWFGKGEMSDLNKKCIESWKKYCSDYEFVRIDETNFDIHKNAYTENMYQNKNWAFVADVARMDFLNEASGFYLDTDMELFKSLDELRKEPAIVAQAGYGLYGNGILGRGETMPEIFIAMLEEGKQGEALYERMNRLVYAKYNTHAGDIERYTDITLLGDRYVNKDDNSIKTEDTIARHHNECTWAKAWKGGFEMFSDLIPVRIHTPYGRNEEQEINLFKQKEKQGDLFIETKEASFRDLEVANLLNNSKIKLVKMKNTTLVSHTYDSNDKYDTYTDNQNDCTVYVKK